MLYHSQVYIPKELEIKLNYMNNMIIDLTYSRHAILAANSDKYGQMNLRSQIRFNASKVIEVETDNNGHMIKLVLRVSYDETRDAVFVLMQGGFVKTVWFNLKSDLHRTLDTSKYRKAA